MMGFLDFLIVAAIVFLVVAVAFVVFFAYHRTAQANVLSAISAGNAIVASHSSTLTSIETSLAGHGITLDSIAASTSKLEDKAVNVITDVEKSKAVQEVKDAIAKAEALVASLTAPNSTSAVPAQPAVPSGVAASA